MSYLCYLNFDTQALWLCLLKGLKHAIALHPGHRDKSNIWDLQMGLPKPTFHSQSISLSWLVVDQCAQKLPHSPDGIISFSLTHFSSPAPLPSPHSVSSSVPSAMLLIFILWSSCCYSNIFVINTLTIDQATKMDSTSKILFLTFFYLLYTLGGWSGYQTGNGVKISYSWCDGLTWLCLAAS